MPDIPTNEPLELRAGDTWKWRREDLAGDYPASTWALTYRFKNAAGGFEVVAAADGDNFAVTVAAATTAAIAAGTYQWSAQVVAAGEKYTVDTGTLVVLADLHAGSAGTASDQRTHAAKMVAECEAAQLGLKQGVASYTIGGRTFTRANMAELIKFYQFWRNELANEEAAERLRNGFGGGRNIQVRFGQ